MAKKVDIAKIVAKLKRGQQETPRGPRVPYKRKDIVIAKPYRERDMRDEAREIGSHGHEYFGGTNEQIKR